MKSIASFSAIVSVFVSAAAAYRQPVGDPTGNPIYRPLNEVVVAGKPFTITWGPTNDSTGKPGTVAIVLCKGPGNNIICPTDAIAEGVPNTGSYIWTPSMDLEDTHGPMGYGIRLISEADGRYQWSTQFGISIPKLSSSSTSTTSTTATAKPTKHDQTQEEPCPEETSTTTVAPEPEVPIHTPPANGTIVIHEQRTTTVECEEKPIVTPPVEYTSVPYGNSSVILVTPSVHTTMQTMTLGNMTATITGPAIQTATGAAERNVVSFGMGLVAAAAGLALF